MSNVLAQIKLDDGANSGLVSLVADGNPFPQFGGIPFKSIFNGASASLTLSIRDIAAPADVPAPAGLFLLASGLIGGGLLMRRRQQI